MLKGLAQHKQIAPRNTGILRWPNKTPVFLVNLRRFRYALDDTGTNVGWIHVPKRGIHESKQKLTCGFLWWPDRQVQERAGAP